MTYDQWFRSQQGIPYEGSYLFAEAAWEHQLKRIVELAAERDAMKYEWQAACSLVAEMHKAAVGDYQGCTNGVVEDIADLKAERDRLRAALEKVIAHDKYVMHQRCPDCDYMCKGECRDMPISQYGKIAQEALKGQP